MAYDGNIHSVAYSTKLDGLCFSFISTVNVDNGTLVSRGDLEEGEREIYKAEFDITKPAYLVLNPAWQYDDATYAKKYDEAYYYIKACTPFRGYELRVGRRFEVSSNITSDSLAKDDYVILDANGKIKKVTSATNASNAFVGKVVAVTTHGFAYPTGSAGTVSTVSKFYTIEVIKNEAVAASTPPSGN